MSIPRSLTLPDVARPATLRSPFGDVAALRAEPSDAAAPPRATVLLLPGFTGSKEDFLALLAPLAAAGYASVAVDQRGQYETVGPEDVDDVTYTLDRFDREACAVAEEVGGDLHVVGHSFGGLVAQAMVLRAPARVRSLTLLGSGPGALPVDQHADLATFAAGLPALGKERTWALMRQRSAATRGEASPEVEEFVRRRFLASSTGSLVGIARILAAAPDRIDELAALGLPTQVVHGEADDAWPPQVQAEVAARLGAPLTVIAGAGHSPNVDDPAATARAITTFLDAVEAGRA